MKLLITGHRKHKLESYNIPWIQMMIDAEIARLKREHGYVRGYAGMASGVDCWFCHSCIGQEVPYVACIPFDGQADTMTKEEAEYRQFMIDNATEKRSVKNSWMVEECDMAIIVWDGNKGGTHNVVQQLIEKKKSFVWINPVAEVVWNCNV